MKKTLVAYFSATGTTESVAKKLASATNGDLYEIEPQVRYTSADLNWQNKSSRSSVEMADKSSRPVIVPNDPHIENYDTVFIGFPIWWYDAPTVINTFLEAYDFSGKKIILFATSGGSGFGNTAAELKSSVSDSTEIVEGKVISPRMTEKDIARWVATLNL